MRIVPGKGPPDAKIVIVGEAPGREEVVRGEPFVGAAGRLLTEMLRRSGIDRKKCYITNIMRRRPPGNDFGEFYNDGRKRNDPSPMLVAGIKRLREEIAEINPHIVIALGAEPLRALTGHRHISKWRGSVVQVDGRKVVATYHPAGVLRMYKHRAVVELDLKHAKRESRDKEWLSQPQYKFLIRPTYDDVMLFINAGHKRLAFDIETVGKRVRCIAFAWGKREAICIPFMTLGHYNSSVEGVLHLNGHGEGAFGSYWSEEEEYRILQGLNAVLGSAEVKLIDQNHPFDSTILMREFGLICAALWIDTLALHHVLYSELPKSLAFLGSIYTDTSYWKGHNAADDEDEWVYNCTDAAVTYECADVLEKEAIGCGLWEFYRDHVQNTMLALTRAGSRGIPIDADVRAVKIKEREDKKEEICGKISRAYKLPDFNPSSPKQVKELLRDRLGMRLPKKQNKQSTDAKAVQKLIWRYPEKKNLLRAIVKYRNCVTVLGNFLTKELRDDGRLVTTYNVSGTVNGRISSSKNIWGEGFNSQQIEKSDVRECVSAPKGWAIIKTDLSQAEARYVYWDAGIARVVDKFREDPKFDIHTWNAAHNIYHVSEEDITKQQRQDSKVGVHGGNYGLGYKGASEKFGVSRAVAKMQMDGYHNGMPEIKSIWWPGIELEVRATRMLRTQFGRRRVFMGRLDNETFRSARAFKPQGTIGDIINRAFFITDRTLKGIGYPLMQEHDEIVFLVRRSHVHEGVQIIKEAYEYVLEFERTPYPLVIPVDVEVGGDWWNVQGYDEEKDYEKEIL